MYIMYCVLTLSLDVHARGLRYLSSMYRFFIARGQSPPESGFAPLTWAMINSSLGVKSRRTRLYANEHKHLYWNLLCLHIFERSKVTGGWNAKHDLDLCVFGLEVTAPARTKVDSSRSRARGPCKSRAHVSARKWANIVIQTSRFFYITCTGHILVHAHVTYICCSVHAAPRVLHFSAFIVKVLASVWFEMDSVHCTYMYTIYTPTIYTHVTVLTFRSSVHVHHVSPILLHTWSCRFKSAPSFTSSLTTPVLPIKAAIVNAEYPSCMYIMYCVLTHWTWCKGTSYSVWIEMDLLWLSSQYIHVYSTIADSHAVTSGASLYIVGPGTTCN